MYILQDLIIRFWNFASPSHKTLGTGLCSFIFNMGIKGFLIESAPQRDMAQQDLDNIYLLLLHHTAH